MFENYQWVIPSDEYQGSTKTFLIDGVCPYTKKTAEDWRAEGYTVVSSAELDELEKEYNNRIFPDWQEISRDDYEDALNVLPPLKWYNGGFFLSEAYSGLLHGFYQQYNGNYYTSLQSIAASRESILQSLRDYLERTA